MTALADPAARKVAAVLIETELAVRLSGADRAAVLRKRRAGLAGQARSLVDSLLALPPDKAEQAVEVFLNVLESDGENDDENKPA